MKKILLGLAAVTTVTAPLATVYVMNPSAEEVKVGNEDSSSIPPFDQAQEIKDLKDSFNKDVYFINEFYSNVPKDSINTWDDLNIFIDEDVPSSITNPWNLTDIKVYDDLINVSFIHNIEEVSSSLQIPVEFNPEVTVNETDVLELLDKLDGANIDKKDGELSSDTKIEHLIFNPDSPDESTFEEYKKDIPDWELVDSSFDVIKNKMEVTFEHKENSKITFTRSFKVIPIKTTSLEVIKLELNNYTTFNSHLTFDQFNSFNQLNNLLKDLSHIGVTSDVINDSHKLFSNSDITYDGYILTGNTTSNTLELLFNNKTENIMVNDISFKNKEDIDTTVVATAIAKLENTSLIGDTQELGVYNSIEELESVYSYTGDLFGELKSIFKNPSYSLDGITVSSNNTIFNYTISSDTNNISLSSTISTTALGVQNIKQEIENASFLPIIESQTVENFDSDFITSDFLEFQMRYFLEMFDVYTNPLYDIFTKFNLPFTINHKVIENSLPLVSENWIEYTLPNGEEGRIDFTILWP